MESLTADAVASVGFPIAVAAYLLIRMENVIKELNKSVQSNTELLKVLVMERCKPGGGS